MKSSYAGFGLERNPKASTAFLSPPIRRLFSAGRG